MEYKVILPFHSCMRNILYRFPNLKTIVPVFAVVAFPIYAWTIVAWLWKLPSWLYFLTPLEIASIFSYAMMTALLECLFALSLIVLVNVVLPPQLFRDVFSVRGTWMALGLLLCFLGNGGWRVARVISGYKLPFISLTAWLLAGAFLTFWLVFFSTRSKHMTSFGAWLSERLIVFLYIQIPVSIISTVVVLVRNIS
jgi:hypothetical protein